MDRNFFLKPSDGTLMKVKLTEREKQVAKKMLHMSAKEAARELGISRQAISFHCANIRLKLDERKTVFAILKAIKYGLI